MFAVGGVPYTRTYGFGPHNFEPGSRTTPKLAPPLLASPPHHI
ncbi:hypothetical protein TNCV_3218641 [Trichonephila clavipes]|nr:hypothetical protein TNCV_3218641 [Trichonephila clavipes]